MIIIIIYIYNIYYTTIMTIENTQNRVNLFKNLQKKIKPLKNEKF